MTHNLILKYLLVGNMGCGKSTISTHYTQKYIPTNTIPTIGVEFYSKKIEKLIRNKIYSIKMQIWDTSGQERYRGIIRTYYRSVHCAFIVFDLSSRADFNSIQMWYNELVHRVNKKCKIVLIGNKRDILTKNISQAELLDTISELSVPYFEICAKNYKELDRVFDSIHTLFIEDVVREEPDIHKTEDKSIVCSHCVIL